MAQHNKGDGGGEKGEEEAQDVNRVLDAWDPMKEAHDDPVFNSYLSGPAATATHLNISEPTSVNKSTFAVYVKGLPKEFEEVHVRSLFRLAGPAEKIIILPVKDEYRDMTCLIMYKNKKQQLECINTYHNHELTDEHRLSVTVSKHGR